jgi:hypothetical protein
MKYSCKILVGKQNRRNHLGDLGTDRRIKSEKETRCEVL